MLKLFSSVRRTPIFGPFELSASERALRRDGFTLPLGSRALDILVYLVERPGEVIQKNELIDHVWSNVAVEEGSLRVQMAAIRKALGDGQFGNRYIANVKGRGYSFIGSVVFVEDSSEDGGARSSVPLPFSVERPSRLWRGAPQPLQTNGMSLQRRQFIRSRRRR